MRFHASRLPAVTLLAIMAATLSPARGEAALPAIRLTLGRSVFWSGPVDTETCGPSCWDYVLDVRDRGFFLRIGIDHVVVGDEFTIDVEGPDGSGGSFSPGTGLYSAEFLQREPAVGRWRLRVRMGDVQDGRFRMRAKLEPEPVEPKKRVRLLPNLQVQPPYEVAFVTPITNGADPPQGAELPGGRVSCHPEEVVEEVALRCLRMTFGVRNTGRGPLDLIVGDGPEFMDRDLHQRIHYSDDSTRERPAGIARWHKTHLHYHHHDAVGLRLLKVTDPQRGALEPAGAWHRKGFAHREELLREWTVFYPTEPRAGFGLGPGWGDYYEWDRPGNYLDFGLNEDGHYVIRMTVDPPKGILESNERDNAGYTYIRVTGETVKVLESGRGTDPWDRCKILMPIGAEPDLPDDQRQPHRPASCPPDTV